MTAIRIGVFDLGLVALLTAVVAAVPAVIPARDAPVEQVSRCSMSVAADAPVIAPVEAVDCFDPSVSAVIVRGRVLSLDPQLEARFNIRLAEMPSGYEAVTGDDGRFEVRIPRAELGTTDLCTLPASGNRPAAAFTGSHLHIEYALSFER